MPYITSTGSAGAPLLSTCLRDGGVFGREVSVTVPKGERVPNHERYNPATRTAQYVEPKGLHMANFSSITGCVTATHRPTPPCHRNRVHNQSVRPCICGATEAILPREYADCLSHSVAAVDSPAAYYSHHISGITRGMIWYCRHEIAPTTGALPPAFQWISASQTLRRVEELRALSPKASPAP